MQWPTPWPTISRIRGWIQDMHVSSQCWSRRVLKNMAAMVKKREGVSVLNMLVYYYILGNMICTSGIEIIHAIFNMYIIYTLWTYTCSLHSFDFETVHLVHIKIQGTNANQTDNIYGYRFRSRVVGKLVSFGVYCFPTTNFQRKPMKMPFQHLSPLGFLFFLFQEANGRNSHLICSWTMPKYKPPILPQTVDRFLDLCEIILTLASVWRFWTKFHTWELVFGAKKTSFFHLSDVFLSNSSFLFVDVYTLKD